MNDDNHDMQKCILICMLVDRQHNNRHATSQAGTLFLCAILNNFSF